MRALSLTPPWPWAILHCGKRIENRQRWNGCNYRGELALHASGLPGTLPTFFRHADDPGYQATQRQADDLGEFQDTCRDCIDIAHKSGVDFGERKITPRYIAGMAGHIVGLAEIVGVVEPGGEWVWASRSGSVRDLTPTERRWWQGGFALLLSDVRPLSEPVPCKGALGLWRVPAEVETEVRLRAGQ